MNIKPLNPKAFVKVVPTKNATVPFDFPWYSEVAVSLQGDLTKLDNIKKELDEIKKLVNKDISKFGMNLKDYTIEIYW